MIGDIFFKGFSRPAVMAIALLLVASVGLLDSMTGPGYSFSAFYLLPVVLTAWYVGRGYAILISVAGAAAWLAAGIVGRMYHEHTLVLLWNDMMELCLFLFAAYVISALRGKLEREEELARTDLLTGIDWPVTLSIGLETYLKAPQNTDEMIRVADKLMYEVKGSGKDELRHLIAT